MIKMTLPMASMPSVIRESIATALLAHGLTLSDDMLDELGRNVTQALWSLDPTDGEVEEPSVADRLAVGETLRALAHGGDYGAIAEKLGRVGKWVSDVARAELAAAMGGKAA